MKSSARIVLALVIAFPAGVVISLFNGRDFLSSIQSAFLFSIFTAAIAAFLSWGIDIAESKGYPGWLGFLLVLFLNILGLAILLIILPSKTETSNRPLD
jgi:hypothetical protein